MRIKSGDPSICNRMGKMKKIPTALNVGEYTEQLEISNTAHGNAKWYNHSEGKKSGTYSLVQYDSIYV